jgi:uncharacterized membrane protein
MSELVVIAYDDEYRAAEVLATLRRLQKEYLIDLEDAVYVTKDRAGKFKLHESADLTAAGAAGGGFWGLLIGLLFFAPLAGLAVGAGAGALAGKLTDVGIDTQFMRELSARLEPGSSALFVLVRQANAERVVPEIEVFGGAVVRTSLKPDAEERLREALSTGGVRQPA